ncbi:hypothetical protein MKX03_009400 [Papaver bracteatum]|nr:hypothetical protein MKX03_009400 [Papaver bracteatum]
MTTKLLLTFVICRLLSTVGLIVDNYGGDHPVRRIDRGVFNGELSYGTSDIEKASVDFGLLNEAKPLGVLHPGSTNDIASLLKTANADGFSVSARGHGHSINGQAHATNGVVIEMSGSKGNQFRSNSGSLPALGYENTFLLDGKNSKSNDSKRIPYVDVWGGELWIDVLKWTLGFGLAPRSWTDYLYLSVGGTLSNAGISGQAFNHGPQISNVFELDVVTGKGELVTCSKKKNSELFNGVLGGLGQFGIITRARIALEPAPQRVRWIRVLYSNFSTFTKDQEYLISLHGKPSSEKFDYVEGFVIVDEGLINNWRSSFFSPKNPIKISSINGSDGGVLYCLEITRNYDDSTANSIEQDIEALLEKLDFIPSSVFTTDLPYVDFLDRVHKAELKLRSKGLWEVPHPWLNLLVPKSRIADFDKGVFKGILGNKTSGPILIYPMNKNKWDDQSSVVTPDEDIFYLVGLLRSALDSGEETQKLDYLKDQNRQILKFCDESGIRVKRYLPGYKTQEEWKEHFGDRWGQFLKRKNEFDPMRILATGQHIFKPSFDSVSSF